MSEVSGREKNEADTESSKHMGEEGKPRGTPPLGHELFVVMCVST